MFPHYFVLEQLLKNYKVGKNLKDYYILSVQHLLRSTGSLFEALIRFGFSPEHIFLTGKIYSAHDETIEKLRKLGINVRTPTLPDKLGHYSEFLEKDIEVLWDELISVIKPNSKLIILDDGGFALKSVPEDLLVKHQVYGIEQTTSGIRLQETFKKFPVIHVASSAAKTIIEPPIVSEAVRIQLGKIIADINPTYIGIVGFGHIGKAIAKDLCEDYRVGVYDIDRNKLKNPGFKIKIHQTKNSLYKRSTLLIGATGVDISEVDWLIHSNGDKTLLSVSSGDIEFNVLLKNCMPFLSDTLYSPMQDLKLYTKQGDKLTILRGGMVANFTGKPDSSPGHIIQMTRGLLFGSVIQIIIENNHLERLTGPIELEEKLQKFVVNNWFSDQPDRRNDYPSEYILRLT